jgi:ABC-type amino acid transport substrate-binding protein
MLKFNAIPSHHLAYKYPLFVLLALLLFFITALSLSESHADTFSKEKNTLQSASELDYPPFSIVRPDGTAGGFSVDLLEAAAHAAGTRHGQCQI